MSIKATLFFPNPTFGFILIIVLSLIINLLYLSRGFQDSFGIGVSPVSIESKDKIT